MTAPNEMQPKQSDWAAKKVFAPKEDRALRFYGDN